MEDQLTQPTMEEPTATSKTGSEEIGFLFIDNKKYPVFMGKNLIGRDPQKCQIVLNSLTVSKQHARISAFTKTKIFVTDLASCNKTKVNEVEVTPYTKFPIEDGDWIDFGSVSGMFQLSQDDKELAGTGQEDDDLPMTQCMYIPETPVRNNYNSKQIGSSTTIPESPDVSYNREESFISPSQKHSDGCFKIPDTNLIKSSKKSNARIYETAGSKVVDDIYWKSSKKSTSLMDSIDYEKDIHSLETQAPMSDHTTIQTYSSTGNKEVLGTYADDIFDAETQALVKVDELVTAEFIDEKPQNNSSSLKNSDKKSTFVPESDEDDDITDCEDAIDDDYEMKKSNKTNEFANHSTQDDILTQIICKENIQQYSEEVVPSRILTITKVSNKESGESNNNSIVKEKTDDINDLATHILEVSPYDLQTQILKTQDDVPTQIICNENIKQYSEEVVPSKILTRIKLSNNDSGKSNNVIEQKGENHIDDQATQNLETSAYDLPTQILKITSPKFDNERKSSFVSLSPHKSAADEEKFYTDTQEVFNDLCSQIETPKETLSSSKNPSDSSDVDVTPKKVKPTSIHLELPSSQEIGPCISLIPKTVVTDTSSDSENDDNSDKNTPVLFKSRKSKKVTLIEKFNVPSRVISRVRKPTPKLINNSEIENILRPNLLFEPEDKVNAEIINENLSRLRTFKIKYPVPSKSNLINENKNDIKEKEASEIDIKQKTRPKRNTKKNVSSQNKIKEDILQNTEKQTRKCRNKITLDKQKVHSENELEKSSKNKKETVTAEKEVKKGGRKKKNTLVDSESELGETKINIPLKEVRRSHRNKNQRVVYTSEQNTVCNSSLDLDSYSAKSLKRHANNCESTLNPKRPRSVKVTDNSETLFTRSAPARSSKTQYVLFTNWANAQIEKILRDLGAVVVNDVNKCTVLLTREIKRTVNFLCAVGLGRPIVGAAWVQACVNAKKIVDPLLYPLKDENREKKYNFDLQKTLCGPRGFLKGYNVSATKNCKPSPAEIKRIVECSGGSYRERGTNLICVSVLADKHMWPDLKRRGATIVSPEVILDGALKQRILIDKYRLC